MGKREYVRANKVKSESVYVIFENGEVKAKTYDEEKAANYCSNSYDEDVSYVCSNLGVREEDLDPDERAEIEVSVGFDGDNAYYEEFVYNVKGDDVTEDDIIAVDREEYLTEEQKELIEYEDFVEVVNPDTAFESEQGDEFVYNDILLALSLDEEDDSECDEDDYEY